jgi:alpha-mannosidase
MSLLDLSDYPYGIRIRRKLNDRPQQHLRRHRHHLHRRHRTAQSHRQRPIWQHSSSCQRVQPPPAGPMELRDREAGFVKPAGLAWYASHHHTVDGLNEPYQCSYLFAYSIDVNANERTLTLPDNSRIRILAVSVARENAELKPAQPLFETLNRTEPPQTLEKVLP